MRNLVGFFSEDPSKHFLNQIYYRIFTHTNVTLTILFLLKNIAYMLRLHQQLFLEKKKKNTETATRMRKSSKMIYLNRKFSDFLDYIINFLHRSVQKEKLLPSENENYRNLNQAKIQRE